VRRRLLCHTALPLLLIGLAVPAAAEGRSSGAARTSSRTATSGPARRPTGVEMGVVDENRQRLPSYWAWKQRTSPARLGVAWTRGRSGPPTGFRATVAALGRSEGDAGHAGAVKAAPRATAAARGARVSSGAS